MADLEVRGLTKSYPTQSDPLPILKGIDLDVSLGESLAILGPSGCGKSTLLQVIGTLDQPTAGQVRLDGKDPFALAPPELARFRNQRIGFVFQDHHLLPQCTVLENVLLPSLAGGVSTAEHASRAKQLVEQVGLAHRADHFPAELSGGERQRAAIARALLLQPVLLLADEPTGNLDRTTAAQITKLLLDLQEREKRMLVVVTHSLELAAALGRRVELDDGKLRTTAA